MSDTVYITRNDLTIANGAQTSDDLDLARLGEQVVGILTPASMTGTAMTFTVCFIGTTFVPLHDSTGAAVSITIGSSRYIYLPPAIFAGVARLRVVSGSVESGAKIISVITRPV